MSHKTIHPKVSQPRATNKSNEGILYLLNYLVPQVEETPKPPPTPSTLRWPCSLGTPASGSFIHSFNKAHEGSIFSELDLELEAKHTTSE